MSAKSAASVDATLHDEMLRERIKLHSNVERWMPWFHGAFIGVLSKGLLSDMPAHLFISWAVVVMTIVCAQAACATYALKYLHDIHPRKMQRYQVLFGALSGASIGALGPLFLSRLHGPDQSLLVCLLVAIPSLGVVVSMSSRYFAMAYAAAVLLPTLAAWLFLYPHLTLVSTVCIALYLGVVIIASAQSEKTLLNSFLIRRERDLVVRDLKRSNAEVGEAVARAEREATARSRVLASASHDLRQPLHALSLYSAILAANPAPETLREVGSHIDQIVRSLGELLHGLLDLSQLSSGHYVSVRQHFAISTLLANICGEFESVALKKGLLLRRELTPLGLNGDPMAVSRIARNLIDNALKYTTRGSVSIRLDRDGDVALLTVADTGRGIAPTDQQRIFEEFYQPDNPGRDRAYGVGLGLAIVERLVHLIGGHVTLDSELGKGSRFQVRIPGLLPELPPAHMPEAFAQSANPANRRIFLVDDEQDILCSMAALLRLWEFEVHAAPDVATTTELFERWGPPDLLIADLRLRGSEHGLAMANRMRDLHGEFNVLFVTGETSSDTLAATKATGWKLLHKPIDAQILRQTIDEVLVATHV